MKVPMKWLKEYTEKFELKLEMIENVPIRFFEDIGYNRNVIILTQPESYQKTNNRLMPLMKMVLGKYPELVKTMGSRHIIYNDTLAYIKELENKGKALVIRPDHSLNIGHIEQDPEELKRVYAIGTYTGIKWLDKVKEFLY